MMKSGAECPQCHKILEFTVGEVTEEIWAPRTYMCGEMDCLTMFTLSIEEVKEIQDSLKESWGIGEPVHYDVEEDIASLFEELYEEE